MATGFEGEHNEIRGRLKTVWGSTTPIAWPNDDFTPPNPPTNWIRLTINDGESHQLGLGALPAVTRYYGNIIVQIFTLQDKGDAPALILADSVKAVFHNWCGVAVSCRQAKIKTVGNDGNGWYQINVNIPFIRDEQS